MHAPKEFLLLLIACCISPVKSQVEIVRTVHPAFSERTSEREQMVKGGIEDYAYNPVRDKNVLNAMRRVPRHMFIPKEYRRDAYLNSPLIIGYNQTISQPYIVAHMTELLDIQPGQLCKLPPELLLRS